MAYDPVTADPLKALASGTTKAKSSDQMTSMNPLTKMIMQYQNMDGKQVIGIAAIGEKVFMGLSYYFNEGLVSDDVDYHRYMKFSILLIVLLEEQKEILICVFEQKRLITITQEP